MNDQMTIPGPPPVKNVVQQFRMINAFTSDIIGFLNRQFDAYGDIVALRFGSSMMVLVSRPEAVHEILVQKSDDFYKSSDYKDTNRGLARFLGNGLLTSDGEFWKRQRRLVAPALHAKRIENYAGTMVEKTLHVMDGWRGAHELDIDREMMRATLTIVAACLFNADVEQEAERVGEAMTILQNISDPFNILPPWVPTPKRRRERTAVRNLDELMFGLIQERRAEGDDRGDLLSMLVLARDDDGGAMSDRQVRDEAVTLFLAGHETTANALNFTWTLLAQNPEVEAKLHEELDRMLAGRTPTFADLKQLPYTEQVVKEVLRLYPPAYSFGRQAIRDTSIGGYAIPAGTDFNVVTFRTHRDGQYWDQPERFIPERFSPEREASIPKHAYLPFGGGPRICIGNSFAMMEARLMLATIAQRYQFRLAPGQKITLDPLITLRPHGGLHMRVEAREAMREYA